MQMLEVMIKTGFISVLLGGLVEESPALLLGLGSNLERAVGREREQSSRRNRRGRCWLSGCCHLTAEWLF